MKTLTMICLCLVLAAGDALAQAYPSRPVRVLSTFNPGTVADGAMRLIAQKMSDSMRQPVIVEAMAGAGGVLAAHRHPARPVQGGRGSGPTETGIEIV